MTQTHTQPAVCEDCTADRPVELCPLHAAAPAMCAALAGLVGVMEAEGNGRWFKREAVAYLTRMQTNLRERAAEARAALAAARGEA